MKTDSKSLFGNLREDLHAAALELVGTVLFLVLGLGGIQAAAFSNQSSVAAAANGAENDGAQAINKVASIEQLLYISVSMGLSLLVSVWFFYRVTGGVFNPAVSTALLLIGAIGPVRWALYCIAQMVGGIIAAALLLALLPGELVVTPSPARDVNAAQAVFIEAFLTSALVLAVLMLAAEKHRSTPFAPIGIGLTLFACHLWGVVFTGAAMNTALLPNNVPRRPSPARDVNAAQAVFIEAFLTSALVLAVLMLAAEKHRSTPFAPIGIGLTLFACHLWGVVFTGAAMNTARAFGPAVVSGFDRDHWVYWVGPFVGSLMATLFYSFLKHIKYWRLNPDQDVADPKMSPPDPLQNVLSRSHSSVDHDRNGDVHIGTNGRAMNGNGEHKSRVEHV
ncbi:unnamed protein product [Rhizoctonia solani]|uniref:Aquaporin-1 n=1 Tax=Rhizoctonia solani TaxID=456999 RepID=A0A8H2XCL4_9AGAM|nr:unnamed protein product [Rhizoctonia solani]